ncbi:MAG: hypothetical protein JWQ38_3532 [Flavipsychrobacter sp.]|nr:hypothetical protein [Flavipsychrobacter sp.]
MKKYLVIAMVCLGAFTKVSAQSMTIVNNSASSIGVNLGASNGTTPGGCSAMNSSVVQMKPASTVTFTSINDLCSHGNVWLGSGCPTTFTVPGSHWDMAKVFVACGIAKVGSGCDPSILTTASLCTGSTVKWTTSGGNVTVTIN